jgi:hypothetical protein
MWLDVVALLLLGIFMGAGALRGGLASALGLITLGVAYAAAVFGAPLLGPSLAAALTLPEFLGLALAGTAGFIGGYLGMGVVGFLLRRRERRRRGGDSRSARDRFFGAIFGGMRGALVVVLLSYLALWLDVLRATGTSELLPSIEGSAAAAVTSSVVEAGVEAALPEDSAGSGWVATAAARPAEAISGFQSVLENPAIATLREDGMFWTYVEHGSVDAALNRMSFLEIAHDESLRAELGDLGLIDTRARGDAGAFRDAAREVLQEVGPRIRGLRNDPELRALVEDPEVVAMLQNGDTWSLVSHPGFRQLVARVTSEVE